MPSDFLLPLFVVTLLANAILVAFAIRGIRRGQWDDDRPIGAAPRPPAGGSTSGPSTLAGSTKTERGPSGHDDMAQAELANDELERAIATRRAKQGVATGSPRPAPARRPVDPESGSPAGKTVAESPGPAAVTPAAPGKRAASSNPRRKSKPAAATSAAATQSAPVEPRRSRRRFSLPPLDDDHEKVNRSLKSFLGGIEGPGATDVAPEPPAIAAPPKSATTAGPTTVALIAVDGLPADAEKNLARPAARPTGDSPGNGASSPSGNAHESDAVAEALAMVERTLRAAARGSDVVTIGDRGRFRIVLPATGELAARAYLRRIRATIEPRLESAGRPLRLAVATATVLDESVDHALERAEDRLSAALAVDRQSDGAPSTQRGSGTDDAGHAPITPRAAAD